MTDTPTPRSHHWFLFLLGVVGIGVVAYLTYSGLLFFRSYQTTSLESQREGEEFTNNAATTTTANTNEETQENTVVDRTESLPIITNGWSTVAGQQRVRGTVVSVDGMTIRIIIDDAKAYPEADVQYTNSTIVENVNTTAFDSNGLSVRTSLSADAITVGDIIEINTTVPIKKDVTVVTATTITRYQ